ncbi:response regulator, partial [Kineosporia sp. A_224]|uniref:response regulator n=1 Tax=Kineosporia sp. A_224 TaxID=1962180 RepID=UPI001303FDC7
MHVIRVLVVDGSRTARTATAETLATDPGVEVVGTADTGPMAFAKTATLKPDVVTLDSEVNDGDLVRTVKALRSTHPSVVVVLVASPTDAGIRTTVEALDAGIADYVTGPAEPRTAIAVQKMVLAHLLPRVKALTGLAPPIPR